MRNRVSKADAANGLLNLNSVKRKGKEQQTAHCPFCGEIFYIGPLSYDFGICQNVTTNEERRLVRRGRVHCTKKHPDSIIWNLLPRRLEQVVTGELGPMIDSWFCVAMVNAARLWPMKLKLINPEMVSQIMPSDRD